MPDGAQPAAATGPPPQGAGADAVAALAAPAPPDPNRLIQHLGRSYRPIREGRATILVPAAAETPDPPAAAPPQPDQQVFYNPIQQYNRDLSCLAIKAYAEAALQTRARSVRASRKRKRGPDLAEAVADSHASPPPATTATSPPRPPSSFTILDALSASGLRALRYALELPFVTSVTANDISASAAANIRLNVAHNRLDDIIQVTNDDALALMYRAAADTLSSQKDNPRPRHDRRRAPSDARRHSFDVVDLDPYGTAAPFFDAALQCVRHDGGLLCITCTDSAVWAGHSYCEKAFALYGGVPVKGLHSHEAALRLILNAIASSAARHGLLIEPLLSLSIDFYVKLFVRVSKSPQAVKFLAANTMLLYSCDQGCSAWETQPLLKSRPAPNKKGSGYFYKHGMALAPTVDRFCPHCGFKMHLGGPMYAGRIHCPDFLDRMLDQIPAASPDLYGTLARLEGMLRTAREELLQGRDIPAGLDPREADLAALDAAPFFVIPGKLASVLSCATPSDDLFRGALLRLGYQVGRSHCRPGSIKTDAPWSVLWWIMTEWVRHQSPLKLSKFRPSMAAWKILRQAGLLPAHDQPDLDPNPSLSLQGRKGSPDGNYDNTDSNDGETRVDVKGNDGDDGNDTNADEAQMEKPSAGPPPSSGKVGAGPADGGHDGRGKLPQTLAFDDDLAKLGRQRDSRRYLRYQMNPQPNWGPMNKAKG